jgi:hypothetical protein
MCGWGVKRDLLCADGQSKETYYVRMGSQKRPTMCGWAVKSDVLCADGQSKETYYVQTLTWQTAAEEEVCYEESRGRHGDLNV